MSLISNVAKEVVETFEDRTHRMDPEAAEMMQQTIEQVLEARMTTVLPAEEDLKLSLAGLDDIVEQLAKRYIGALVVIERQTNQGSDQQATRLYYRGGHTLAIGLASKSCDILNSVGDRWDYRDQDNVGETDEDEDGD
jgi:hypothetical protein